ncbi:hypothetical protein LK533_01420 [Sphingomonas sp. PL-96]|uniref:hypothetical protein n=1 Tax=Sphingomonas sp. PL-96 TaxID=2887201 RepID=UPI001E4CD5FC|nr:hypothetical protein [Sphingomonas sp. PL-96]MCC2975331.1 hypothetical protein [Sphingomonas sp. PL-96]
MRGGGATRVVLTALAAVLGTMPAAALAPGLQVTEAIETGQWLVRERGAKAGGRTVCLRDVASLIQMHHAGAQCSRFVIDNGPRAATVHYTCPGAGHGRTTITVETTHAMTVETQGIADGLPFQDEYWVRRTGSCKAGGSR